MDIYRLTPLGEALSHNVYAPRNNPKWRVIFYLAKHGARSKEDIVDNTGANGYILASLRNKRIISGGESVTV